MLSKVNNGIINVFGDTLDSCVYTRMLSEKYPDKTIYHYSSGNFGGIYSDSNGMLGLLNETRKNIILSYIQTEFIPITETYVKVPYSKLDIKNTTDGNIRFPFTKKSFEFDYDFYDVILSTPTYEEFMTNYIDNKNLVKCMKNVFADSFYMNVSKKIGTNIFDVIQSQLDPKYLYKALFNMDSLLLDEYFIYYSPAYGFTDLCTKLLAKSNIKVILDNRKSLKKALDNNNMNYLFDYFDYYMDFIFGGIEYTKFTPIEYKKTLLNTDQICRVYTPYDKKYGIYYQIDNIIYAVVNSKYLIKSNYFDVCMPTPSQLNYKKIKQYVELTNNIPNISIMF